jgi:hypothetical protein
MFVPFGGHYGDCGDYHGLVVALDSDPPRLSSAWATRAAKGGIWAPAGLSEADGHLYFSAGTTEGARSWQDGEGCSRSGLIWFIPKTRVNSLLDPTGSSWMRMILISGASHLCHPRHPAAGRTEMRNCSIAPIWAASPPLLRCVERHEAQSSPLPWLIQCVMPWWWLTRRAAPRALATPMCRVSAHSQLRQIRAIDYTRSGVVGLDGRGAPIVTTTDGKSEPIVWAVGAEGDDSFAWLPGRYG